MKLYNKFLENAVLPFGDLILKTEFRRGLKKWRKIQYFNKEQINKLQEEKLNNVLRHAARNISFYKSLKNKNDITLKDFPVIKKTDLKNETDSFLWHPNLKEYLVCEKSSGSSGIQVTVYMSKKEQSQVMALQTLMWEWAGYKIGSSMVQTGMTKRTIIKKIKDGLFRVKYQLAFGLEEKAILGILKKLQSKKKSFLGGYASSLYLFAETAKKYAINDIKFNGIISWGDKMFDHYRKSLETSFSCKVFDIYGTTEGFVIAGQKDHSFHYIFTPQVKLELLNDQGIEVKDGEIGHVVVTHLDAYEMPLIRYDIGDLAIKLPVEKYPKENELEFPLLEKIIGRDTDIIKTKSGKFMIVHSFTRIFEHIAQIKQFRVIQESLDQIIIEFIPDKGFSYQILEGVTREINKFLDNEIAITYSEVMSIPDSPSGKPQIIVVRFR